MKKLFLSIVLALASACGDAGETHGTLESDDIAVSESPLTEVGLAATNPVNTFNIPSNSWSTSRVMTFANNGAVCANGTVTCTNPYLYTSNSTITALFTIRNTAGVNMALPSNAQYRICLVRRDRVSGVTQPEVCTPAAFIGIPNPGTVSTYGRSTNIFDGAAQKWCPVYTTRYATTNPPLANFGDMELTLKILNPNSYVGSWVALNVQFSMASRTSYGPGY